MINKLVLFFIFIYQKVISKYIIRGRHCRFDPTCSEYARQAFIKYPFFKALKLSLKRISKCHPFHDGGYDPLP